MENVQSPGDIFFYSKSFQHGPSYTLVYYESMMKGVNMSLAVNVLQCYIAE